MPRTIVDENIPRDVTEWLASKGFDVISVSQIHLKGAKDHAIAEYASKNNLKIVTMDKDFRQIYHTFKKDQITIIIVRANPAVPANIIEVLSVAQQRINLKEAKNNLIIISKKKIRIIT